MSINVMHLDFFVIHIIIIEFSLYLNYPKLNIEQQKPRCINTFKFK